METETKAEAAKSGHRITNPRAIVVREDGVVVHLFCIDCARVEDGVVMLEDDGETGLILDPKSKATTERLSLWDGHFRGPESIAQYAVGLLCCSACGDNLADADQ